MNNTVVKYYDHFDCIMFYYNNKNKFKHWVSICIVVQIEIRTCGRFLRITISIILRKVHYKRLRTPIYLDTSIAIKTVHVCEIQ